MTKARPCSGLDQRLAIRRLTVKEASWELEHQLKNSARFPYIDSGGLLLGIEPTTITTKAMKSILIFLLVTPIAAYAEAWGRLSTEESRVGQLVVVSLHYSAQNGGIFPESLEQIRNIVDLPAMLDVNPALGNFGERHCFIRGDLRIPGFGRIITLGYRSDYKLSGAPIGAAGRVVGYIDNNGTPSAQWIPESEIQKALSSNPDVQVLPPMGPIPAPNKPLPRKESPPDEHHLRVLEYKGRKLKPTPTAENASPSPVISNPPPATSNPQASPPASKPWGYLVAGLIAMLVGLWAFTKKRKPR